MNINFAFDYSSVRRNDADGHLFVGSSVISAAQVNPYNGREIPGYAQLGLDPDRKYMLLRDPAALEAAVPGLHGKPLLIKHRAQTSGDYDPDVTIGAVMNPRWVSPNIEAELEVWHPDGVKAIEGGQKTELSAGYRYTPILEPGTYNGQPYDGRMTDLQFNHVSIVEKGRVDGAVVGDELKLKEFFEMDKTAFYRALGRAEDRAVARVAAARRAEADLSPYLGRQMAFDDAEEAYVSALTALGVAPQELEGLELAALKILFKHVSGGANLEGSPSLNVRAGSSALDDILAGVTAPQLTAGLALTGYTGNAATAKTTRGMADDSRRGASGSALDQILKNCGAKKPVDMSMHK